MKHLKIKLALVTVLLSFAFTPSSAYGFEVDGIYYNVLSEADRTCEVVFDSHSGNITIPEKVTYKTTTYSVTTIGDYAFQGSNLTSITIPNSVTTIGDAAFANCSNLTSVTIPNSVTTIGDLAFYRCSGLTSVSIGNSVTTIGDFAFWNCSSLTSVTIGNSVTTIGDFAFWNCSSLTSVTIGNSVTTIGDYAFSYCSSLTNITIPNSVTTIGSYAFRGCSNLTSVNIPNSVTTIGGSAFYGCSGLTSVTIGNSVTTIGDFAFYGCSGLETFTIADGSSELNWNYSVFYDCPLKNVYLGRNINYINSHINYESPFKETRLTNLIIGDSVTTIDRGTFYCCSNLTDVTIGNSVTTIGSSAFSDCSGLTSITIPNSVTTIGNTAFANCSELTSVTIGNSVTTIGSGAFSGCSNLTDVTIGNSVTTIDRGAFERCSSLTSVTIPDSVTTIGDYAFDGCSSLETLTIADGPNELNLGHGYSSNDNMDKGLFYDCPLKNVYLGRNLTYNTTYEYGYSPFYKTKELTNLIIGNSVTTIGDNAFCNCSGLTNLIIPNSVTKIGGYAFSGCSSLENLTISDGSSELAVNGYNALFAGCPLRSVYLGRNINYNNNNVSPFNGSVQLTNLIIGDNVTAIGEKAFFDCSALENIISLAITAPIAYENTFSETTYSNATLYIHTGSLPSYKLATCWRNFLMEEVYNITKVEGVGTGNNPVEIARYSLNGKKLFSPEKGINIIKMSDGTTRKVIVR